MDNSRKQNDDRNEWLVDDDDDKDNSIPNHSTATPKPGEATSASVPQPQQSKSASQIWAEIRQEYKERSVNRCEKSRRSNLLFYGNNHPGCPHCADNDRATMRELRQLSADHANVYSWISLDPDSSWRYRSSCWPADFTLLLLGVSVQLIVPVAVATQQYRNLEDGICPHREKEDVFDQATDKAVGRLLVFALSLYFGVASMNSLLGKLRGNAFLYYFSALGTHRKRVLAFGFVCQGVGLLAANIAEYLLFVGRGPGDFLVLLFTSTTMLGTINGDSNNLVTSKRSDQQASIVSKILSDEAMELGEDGTAGLPAELIQKLNLFRRLYDCMTLGLFLLVVILTASVTFCI